MDDLYSPAPCSFTAGVALAACATRPYYTSSIDLTSPIPFELTAASLGLMLVFRTNESYARFIKAHEAWNLIMSRQDLGGAFPTSRAIEARYITLDACKDPELCDLLGRYLLAFPIALKNKYHPQGARSIEDGVPGAGGAVGDDDEEEVGEEEDEEEERNRSDSGSGSGDCSPGMTKDLMRVLRPYEAADMSRRLDKPGHVLHVLYTAAGHLGEQEGVRMPTLGRFMECLASFSGAARQCDMLVTTPIPLSYTRHTSRFLMIWLSLLAFPLADELSGFAAVPALFFISMLLLGVEEIGVQIEEPLSIMDLEGMVATLEAGFEEAEHAAEDVDAIFLGIGLESRGGAGAGAGAEEEVLEVVAVAAEPEVEIEWWKKTRFYE